jgi:pyruvate dehydrogenase E1 component beta subunit
MADAIRGALDQSLASDRKTIVMGEDVGRLGGVFRITDGLQVTYGPERVIDTPLAEAGLVGTAVGLALNGFRPIVEIQFDGFIFPALNQICTHVARMAIRTGESSVMPITIRVPVGGRFRATELHSESPETYFAYTPDLRVVAASTTDTAGALLRAAVASDQPYVFLEPKRLYRRGRVQPDDEVAAVDLTRARRLREGGDMLLVSYGPMIDFALAAADALAGEGIAASVLDLVTLAPLDTETILECAAESGRVVVAGEGIRRCSIASEVVSLLATDSFGALRTAPRIVSAPNKPYPSAQGEDGYLPSLDDVLQACREVVK